MYNHRASREHLTIQCVEDGCGVLRISLTFNSMQIHWMTENVVNLTRLQRNVLNLNWAQGCKAGVTNDPATRWISSSESIAAQAIGTDEVTWTRGKIHNLLRRVAALHLALWVFNEGRRLRGHFSDEICSSAACGCWYSHQLLNLPSDFHRKERKMSLGAVRNQRGCSHFWIFSF